MTVTRIVIMEFSSRKCGRVGGASYVTRPENQQNVDGIDGHKMTNSEIFVVDKNSFVIERNPKCLTKHYRLD